MMQPLQPTMLWEATDPQVALPKRFQFATPEAATHWLSDTVEHTYGIAVASVDRLVMSSYNLLAWLTTETGPLLAKCCAFTPAHPRLRDAAELVVWLEQETLPVSAPLVTKTGEVQVICDHLSLGVQRVITGALLDPTQLAQAHAAGVTLAHLHGALAIYPRAAELAAPASVPALSTVIVDWANQKMAAITDPALIAGSTNLLEQVSQLAATPLTAASLATQLVHGDYRAANLLWQDDKLVAVLDFEEVRWGYRVNDLAWAAVHLGTRYHDWGPVSTQIHHAFLRSYTAVHPLTALEEAWLPALLAWHSISLTQAAIGKPAYTVGIDALTFYLHLLQSGSNLSLPGNAAIPGG